jgi:hypothetical protein
MVTIRIRSLVVGGPTPYDDQYVVDYDPGRDGVDPWGRPMNCHLLATPDRSKALWLDLLHAHALWSAVDPRNPIRPDGKPNRPLTAFTVALE